MDDLTTEKIKKLYDVLRLLPDLIDDDLCKKEVYMHFANYNYLTTDRTFLSASGRLKIGVISTSSEVARILLVYLKMVIDGPDILENFYFYHDSDSDIIQWMRLRIYSVLSFPINKLVKTQLLIPNTTEVTEISKHYYEIDLWTYERILRTYKKVYIDEPDEWSTRLIDV